MHKVHLPIVIDSINFRENWLIFLGIWGEAELVLGIWGAKEKYFQGAELLSGSWGDQCIIFRDQGSTDPPPPGGASADCILLPCNLPRPTQQKIPLG